MFANRRIDRKTSWAFCLMLSVAAVLSGCSAHDVETESPADPVVVEDDGPIELVFACMSGSNVGTRLEDNIVQSGSSYRSLTGFRFFAHTDMSFSFSAVDKLQGSVEKASSRFYHFGYCSMAQGVNGCLVYAKAKDASSEDGIPDKIYNGSLRQTIPPTIISKDEIFFEPVSIYGDATVGTDGVHADAWILANALTDIANISTEDGSYWRNWNENPLKQLFAHFTNYGYDLPGSAASVRKWIEAVRDAAKSYGSLGDGTKDEFIRQAIIDKANDYLKSGETGNILSLTYPQNINLPDGAAALRWAEVEENGSVVKKFVPQLQTTTLDDINSVSRFVYPPALYYFVNSGIRTSNSSRTLENYDTQSDWSSVLLTYFTSGSSIGPSTRTVAIADPLQYAVARLDLQVKASVSALEYGAGSESTIAISDLSLKGVIIGGQRTVGYDFKPINNSDMDVKFVYDAQVNSGFTTDFTTSHTLVLQSYDGEDVNVILEFEYSGSQEFKCLNGWVYPGTRFYLVGEVKLDDNPTHDYEKRVFTQDYTTTIKMTVSSLEKAYNVLPSILAKNLEIGVKTTPVWTAATPGSVIME